MIILFHLAPSRMLYDKYFSRYDFLKIYLWKIQMKFFWFFTILCRINKRVYLCLFEHANTRKHVYEHSCSTVRVFLSILAHLAHFAQSFFLISNAINELIFWYMSKQADTKKHVSEHKCSSVRVFFKYFSSLSSFSSVFFSDF